MIKPDGTGAMPAEVMMPPGVIELAADMAGAGPFTSGQLVDLLMAPLRLEPDWPAPPDPIPVAGGWIHGSVLDEDRPLLRALMATHGSNGPEAVAAAAQELRLPVTPYRTPTAAGHVANGHDPLPVVPNGPIPDTDLRGSLVVDLTTHWAGPLATKLLAEDGAEVVKVDPAIRPDGFRDRPSMYRHLNNDKQTVDLDLRNAANRTEFERLLSQADLLVESFSRRVMGNLGYGRSALANHNPQLAIISIKAFGANTAEQDWVAYGPGVHAASGLGYRTGGQTGGPGPASLAYPDFLTGIAGAAAGRQLLTGDWSAGLRYHELAMSDVIRPLTGAAGTTPPQTVPIGATR